MKKIELLSPVGDFECLKAAVQNGANSVYFGASNFNARISANNFDLSELKKAISYAKLRGVHTHLTLNTLIKDSEFEEAVLLAKKAYEFGIDAIIVQDLGLARYLINNFPDLPIHASTQMTIHNLEGVKEAEKLGFKRVVLSRELSLDEISYICSHSNVEIETFIHGALCICYSGQCLFSSMVGGRSGNRGKCAQPCRLPYDLISKDSLHKNQEKILDKGYLLSTRDLCGLDFIPELINAGVMCFKIEGRMKSPEYVATVTRIYRKYIDLALSTKPYKIDNKDVEDLKQVFNRGGFSNGHLDREANKNLVFPEKQNNMGIYIGNVSNVKPNKGHIVLNLTAPLSIGDTISFEKEPTKYTVSELMQKNKNIQKATKGEIVEIGRMKGNINIGDKIYKLSSKELSISSKESYKNENKKIPLKATICLEKDKPIILKVKVAKNSNVFFEDISVSFTSNDFPVEARNKPITQEKIIEQLNKTTDTIFEFTDIKVKLENNLFLPSIKTINELRRNALDEILFTAQQRILRHPPKLNNIPNYKDKINIKGRRNISLLLNIIKLDIDYSMIENIDSIYIPLKYFADKKYDTILKDITIKYDTYIYLPTIIKNNYRNLLNNVIDKSAEKYRIKGFVISNLGNIDFLENINKKYKNKFRFIGNYTLNVYNNQSINELKELGISMLTISPELDLNTIKDITQKSTLDEQLIVYGRTPLMNTNYCLLGKTNKCYPTCGMRCMEKATYYLKDRLGLKFPIIPDNIQTVTTIYNSKITSINGADFSVNSYRIDILDEDLDQINSIIQIVRNNQRFNGKEYTNGNLNREI